MFLGTFMWSNLGLQGEDFEPNSCRWVEFVFAPLHLKKNLLIPKTRLGLAYMLFWRPTIISKWLSKKTTKPILFALLQTVLGITTNRPAKT